jgi:hypothetical protein
MWMRAQAQAQAQVVAHAQTHTAAQVQAVAQSGLPYTLTYSTAIQPSQFQPVACGVAVEPPQQAQLGILPAATPTAGSWVAVNPQAMPVPLPVTTPHNCPPAATAGPPAGGAPENEPAKWHAVAEEAQRNVEALRAQLLLLGVQPCV